MSKRVSQWVILGEDTAHQTFARRYLIEYGARGHDIRLLPVAASTGGGDGIRYVLDKLPDELRRVRTRSASVRTGLIVLIDADAHDISYRQRQVNDALASADLPLVTANERVAILFPKRAIETWIYFLTGHATDETTDYKNRVSENMTKPAAKCMRESVQNPSADVDELPSLSQGVRTLRKLNTIN